MKKDSMSEMERDLSCVSSHFSRWTIDSVTIQFYTIRNNVVVIMKNGSKLYFSGKLILRVLYGAVEVHGSIISTSNDPIEVYSPRGYSFVAIETSEKYLQCTVNDIWTILTAEGINRDNEEQLCKDFDNCKPGNAVLLLKNLENNLTRFLNTFYPFRLFPEIKDTKNYAWTDSRKAEIVLQANFYFDESSCKYLIVDPIISEIKEKMLDQWRADDWCCTLISGGQGVGKSTAMRCLINNLLPITKQVVLIDLDIGQCECTPPACISYSLIEKPFMGPNFTHLNMPLYQLYIGDVNVVSCIKEYFKGVEMLIDKLLSSSTLSRLPIIVNTMGFTNGIGWDIAMYIIKVIRPSIVLQIISKRPKNNFNNFLSSDVVNQQKSIRVPWSPCKSSIKNVQCKHELRVIHSHAESRNTTTETWNIEPYQKRELVMISYLSGIINYSNESIPLIYYINEAVPYMAPFGTLNIALPQQSVPPSHVLTVINSNIVALCGIDLPEESFERPRDLCNPKILSKIPLCPCYGFGIIRGVDMQKREIFINTPLPPSVMEYVNCLVGCIPLPQSLHLNQQGTLYASGINTLPTSREPRRGYFRMRYRNKETSP